MGFTSCTPCEFTVTIFLSNIKQFLDVGVGPAFECARFMEVDCCQSYGGKFICGRLGQSEWKQPG